MHGPPSLADMAVAALAEQLRDGDASVRQAAVLACAKWGRPPRPRYRPWPNGSGTKIRTLPAMPPRHWQRWRRRPCRASPGCFATNARGFGNLPRGPCGRSDWRQGRHTRATERLRDCDVSVRQAAVFALREMGPEAKFAIPALAELLRDQDAYVASDASQTIAKMGPEAVPCVTPLLRDRQPHVRELAAQTLRQIGLQAALSGPQGR